jgi:endonuclease YncB( thermonuclease family)
VSGVRPLWRSLYDALVFFAVLVLVLLAIEFFGGSKISPGQIAVIDGDSLREGNTEIRLFGIDAPEYHQLCNDFRGTPFPCGRRAAEELRNLIKQGHIICKSLERDRYGRSVSRCQTGATDINFEMVKRGWALAYVQYGTDYVAAETEARQAKRGLWAGTFNDPADFRKQQRAIQGDTAGLNKIEPD